MLWFAFMVIVLNWYALGLMDSEYNYNDDLMKISDFPRSEDVQFRYHSTICRPVTLLQYVAR